MGSTIATKINALKIIFQWTDFSIVDGCLGFKSEVKVLYKVKNNSYELSILEDGSCDVNDLEHFFSHIAKGYLLGASSLVALKSTAELMYEILLHANKVDAISTLVDYLKSVLPVSYHLESSSLESLNYLWYKNYKLSRIGSNFYL